MLQKYIYQWKSKKLSHHRCKKEQASSSAERIIGIYSLTKSCRMQVCGFDELESWAACGRI